MSYDFEGTQAYATSATTPLNASPLSIIAWIKADAQAADRVICALLNIGSPSDYYLLRVTSTDTLQAVTRDAGGLTGTAATTATITEGAWTLVHGTWVASDASRRAGINGADYVSEATVTTPDPAPDSVYVGMRPTNLNWYDGKIALVAVYNKVLSDSEITELVTVQPESASSYADCVAYWDMRDDEGTTTIPNAKNPGTYDLTLSTTATTKPVYVTPADNPTLSAGGGSLLLPQYDRCFRQNTLLRM